MSVVSEAVKKRRARFSPEVLEQIQKLGRMMGAEKYGQDGPPIETTWAEIEDAGHELGKLVATEYDQLMQRQHAEKFDVTHPCPQCGKQAGPSVKHRELTTRDGAADLYEPELHCVSCERSFFPSKDSSTSGRK